MLTKITIVTATFNSGLTLSDCLNSVSSQHTASEHLIIDGGSTDNTLAIARSYPHISRIVSECDNGLYDAMNKGIALASCNVIGILNSDDFYANDQVLSKVAEIFEDSSIDTCYGDLQYVAADETSKIIRNWKAGEFSLNGFHWGWMPPHPTLFVRRRIYEKYGMFNLDLGSAADYELMLRFLVKNKVTTKYIPEVLVKMRNGGVSNRSFKNRINANRMDRKAWNVNGLRPYPWTTIIKPLRKIPQYLF